MRFQRHLAGAIAGVATLSVLGGCAAQQIQALEPKIELRKLSVGFGGPAVARDVDLVVPENSIYALIGPAGSGKTSILRTINLLSVDVDRAEVTGQVLLDGQDILHAKLDRAALRRRIGMVFATPQPLPGSVYDNLVYGPRRNGVRRRAELDELAESSLRTAELWDEVKDRLKHSALALSGGQQQRHGQQKHVCLMLIPIKAIPMF